MINDLLRETEGRMNKAIEALEEEFRGLRTGRATPALIERVMVDYYGTPTPLKQLAVISAPEPQLLLVRPYDPGSLGAIEKAILQADLGFNPNNDGRVVRVPIPRLTEERRREMVKQVKRRVEEARVALRNVRRDALNDLREFEEEKLISEDELKRAQEDLQKLTDQMIQQVDELGERKEQELLEV
ncbi:MAG: ribosome recycling factor [Chloroflexi bacterium]|nr:ribosome recycling factor [Chloroflexota bacterium]OQA95783.1 MAG: Ribosome-recycling factor [Chloroflexi bacterium ADurb.Bin222]HOC20382.1 ribosome recycling factor [Anaerolineae bacterium]HOS80464.1 ribosome recycling factor [Anaerolineae bacterium]HQE99497.1 ribosome recycling factor [Anaerolineae bacterium]